MKNLPQIRKGIKIIHTLLDYLDRGYSRFLPKRIQEVPRLIPSSAKIRRILVIQLFAMGDLLLSLPLLKGLRSDYPDTEIDFWIVKNWRELEPLLPYVNRIITTDSRDFMRTFLVIRSLRKRRYDLAFILYPVVIGSWLAFLAGAKYRIGYTRDFDDREFLHKADSFLLTHPVPLGNTVIHDTQRYLALGRHLGLPCTWEAPFLYIPSSANSYINQFLQQRKRGIQTRYLIGINPNASWLGKRWPDHKFAALADLLIKNLKAEVIFFGSKSEKEYVDSVISRMASKPLSAAGRTSLVEMAALIRCCSLFISNDSGPMHMACALDVPTLAIMGPTRVEMFRPWATQAELMQSNLPCTPCQYENTDHCRHFSCIRSISVSSVYRASIKMIQYHS
ncbi:MAG: lipopolysaccharide heptosyltransferase II [bacterium]